MFGTIGGPELLLILVIALIVFGPRKLPEIGKSMGKMLLEFRKASTDFRRTIEDEVEAERTREARGAAPAGLPAPQSIGAPGGVPTPGLPGAPPAGTVSQGAAAADASGDIGSSGPSTAAEGPGAAPAETPPAPVEPK